MTIKEFAKLCSCNPQTLRYYDKVDLLKPREVDDWTGYRYYDEQQALDFVKIKNLQEAEFSIKEIKELLMKCDEDIYRAFDKKIEEQIAKLEQIRKIQNTYLSEKQKMEATIKEIKERIQASAVEYDPTEEFGFTNEYYKRIIGKVTDMLERAAETMENVDVNYSDLKIEVNDVEEEEENKNPLSSNKYTTLFEKHGWSKTKEVLEYISDIDDGEYVFHFEMGETMPSNMAFCNVILGYVLDQNKGKSLQIACNCNKTQDEENHFWLLKAKISQE